MYRTVCTLHLSGQSPLSSFPLPSSLYLLVSHSPCSPIDCLDIFMSVSFVSFTTCAQLIGFLSLSIHLFPRYECGLRGSGGACDILLNANYQRLLTVFYYLLALPCPLFPSLALSLSCCLSLARFSLFYFQYATHTVLPLFPSLLPAIAAPFFSRNLRQLQAERGGRGWRLKRECGRIVCVCLCVRGHPPRLSRDLHRNVHTFFLVAPSPIPPTPSGCLFLCLFCFLASSVTNFDACLIRYATISFSFAMLSPFPSLFPLFPLSLPLL